MSISSDINSSLSFFQSLQRQKAAQAKEANKVHVARDKYLGNQRSLTKEVGYLTGQLLPERAVVKKSSFGGMSDHMAIDAAFDDDNPLKGIGEEVMGIATSMQGKRLKETGPQALQAIFADSLARRLDDAHRYKLKQETSVFGKDTGALPFHDEWRANWDETEGKRDAGAYLHGVTPKGLMQNAAMLTGGNLALEGIGRASRAAGWKLGAKAAGRGLFKLPVPGAPGFATKLAGLALMSLADFAVFDAAAEVVGQSAWAKARPDEAIKTTVAEMVAGGGAAYKMAPRLKRSMKVMAHDKVMNRAAAEVLEKEGTVKSLMEYNRSVKRLKKSKLVTEKELEGFKLKNSKVLEEFEYQAYDPDIPGGAARSFTKKSPFASVKQDAETLRLNKEMDDLVEGYNPDLPERFIRQNELRAFAPTDAMNRAGWSAFDSFHVKATYGDQGWAKIPEGVKPSVLGEVQKTPLLEAPSTHYLLPAPVEKWYGSLMNRDQRLAYKSFYEQFTQTGRGVIEMGQHGPPTMSPENLTALHKYMANHPNSKIPGDFFGREHRDMVAKMNDFMHVKTNPTATESVLGYGSVKPMELTWMQKANSLDKAGIEEVGKLAKDGVPPEVGTAIAHTKSTARKAHATPKKSKKRGDEVVAATKKDVKKASDESKKVIVRRKGKGQEAEGLTKEETKRVASGGAQVVRDLRPLKTKKRVGKFEKLGDEIPIKQFEEQLPLHPEFAERGPVIRSIVDQIKKGHPGSAVASGKYIDEVITAARDMKTIYGRPILAPRSAISKAPMTEPEKILEETMRLRELGVIAEGSDDLSAIAKALPAMRRSLVLVPLASAGMLVAEGGGTDADAGVLGKTTLLAMDLAKKAGAKNGKELIEYLNKTNMVGEKGTILGQVKKWQDGIDVAPTVASVKSLATKVPSFVRNVVMTPGAVADFFYKAEANPMVEWASRITAAHNNAQMHSQAVKEIVSMVPEYKNASTKIRKAMKPLVEEYEVPIAIRSYHTEIINNARKQLKTQSVKKDPELVKVFEDQIKQSRVGLKDATEQMKGYDAAWTSKVKELSAEHSGTRMALALEDTAAFEHYPWLKELMSPDEMAAVSRLKDLNKVTEARIVEAGGDVIRYRPFAHHAIHPDSSTKKIKNALGEITIDMQDALAYSRLHSRAIGSRMMMPDLEYSYSRYIPDVERRIQGMKFWKKGEKGGWDAHMKDLRRHGMMSDQMGQFWNLVKDSLKPTPQSKPAEWARRYYSLEVAWRLFLSPSVGFKHLMKQTGNAAIFPLDTWGKGVGKAPKVLYDVKLNEFKERFPKAFSGVDLNPSEEAKLVKAYMNQGKYSSAIAELDMFDAPLNRFDTVLSKFNEAGSAIVGTVENFDRAATILMGMEMAAKKGMTPGQATYAVYDTILKANFLSGALNPAWVRDPYARAFFMFQGTPYKLMEQRVMRAMKAGKDIKKAVGITWDELQGARHYAKEGELRIKHGMAMDALGMTKDLYGTSLTKQFMVNVLTLGGLIGMGDAFFDADLHDHAVHLPFLKFGGSGGVGLAMNPIVTAGFKTFAQRHKEDRELLFTEFWNNWSGPTGAMPASMKKSIRLTQDDIPEIYRGSAWKYIFAVPAAHE